MLKQRLVHWVAQTSDKKTGKIVVSYSPESTCPDSCSLKNGGCYAWGLFYLKKLSRDIESGFTKARTLKEALEGRRKDCKVVRHRVAGDVVGDVSGTIEECLMVEQEGLTNIGYTHCWEEDEAQPLKGYFRASCQTIEEAMRAREMGWGVSLVVPKGVSKFLTLPNGEKAIKCPARYGVEGKRDITCNDCTLCKITDKTVAKAIMFEVHGNKGTLNKAVGKYAKI